MEKKVPKDEYERDYTNSDQISFDISLHGRQTVTVYRRIETAKSEVYHMQEIGFFHLKSCKSDSGVEPNLEAIIKEVNKMARHH